MALIYINARCKQILNLLLSRSEYLTMNQIAKEMKVSRRTVYYDICKINLWLEQVKLPALEVVREKGLLLSHNEREKIQTLLESDTDEQVYIFSPEERVKIIICYIIYEKDAVYLEQLMDCCEVSRNTIFSNLKDVEKRLAQYDLSLEYQPKTGYEIIGNPVHIRALFILFFNELSSLFHTGTIKFFQRDATMIYFEKLKKIEEELGISYVEGAMYSLAALVPIMYAKEKPLALEGLKELEIAKTKEYKLIEKYFPDLEHEEKIYFSLHLLGSRVNIVPDEYLESNSKQYIYDLTRFLISEFEKIVIPVITVHPILTEFDRRSILNHKLVAPKSVLAQRERIFQVVKKYVKPEDYTYLLDDITAFVQHDEEDSPENHAENNLLSILDVSRIQVISEECSWQSSIRLAAQCLLNYQSIEKAYIDTMITQLQYYGPYMFLTDDVILAHARPENGVNCLDISMAAFLKPVIFSSLRKAKLVFVLAAEDQEKHLKILQDILALVSDSEYVDKVSACTTSAEVYYLTKQLLT